jgi:hypothetical protein
VIALPKSYAAGLGRQKDLGEFGALPCGTNFGLLVRVASLFTVALVLQ